jgi:hypothetical protein
MKNNESKVHKISLVLIRPQNALFLEQGKWGNPRILFAEKALRNKQQGIGGRKEGLSAHLLPPIPSGWYGVM